MEPDLEILLFTGDDLDAAAVTDWRTDSLPAHRTWTALGFKPTDYRLHRQIDERIAWADGSRV